MARRPFMVANWKMFKTTETIRQYFSAITVQGKHLEKAQGAVDVGVAVPYPYLSLAKEVSRDLPLRIAAQNVHHELEGAYTGEVSVSMLKDLEIDLVIIGHSERRQYFGETDKAVATKVGRCIEEGIHPIVCVGETLEQREKGLQKKVIEEQLEPVLTTVQSHIGWTIAYEPVWAIGTGLAATADQAQEMHEAIRALVAQQCGETVAEKVRLQYGGSTKPANIESIFTQTDVDGALVGGASLDPASFLEMIEKVSALSLSK